MFAIFQGFGTKLFGVAEIPWVLTVESNLEAVTVPRRRSLSLQGQSVASRNVKTLMPKSRITESIDIG